MTDHPAVLPIATPQESRMDNDAAQAPAAPPAAPPLPPPPEVEDMPEPLERMKLPLVEVPLARFLWTITLVNVTLIAGGTLYGGYKVESIQDRYAEAQRQIDAATDKYRGAAAMSAVQMQAASAAIGQANALSEQAGKIGETLAGVSIAAQKAQAEIQEAAASQATALKDRYEVALAAVEDRQKSARKAFEDSGEKLVSDLEKAKRETSDRLARIDSEAVGFNEDANRRLTEVANLNARTAKALEDVRRSHEVDARLVWNNTDKLLLGAAGAFLVVYPFLVAFGVSWGVRRRLRKLERLAARAG